jgi:putative transposase
MRIRSRMPRIGTRKLQYLIQDDLKNLGIKMGRDVLFDFLRAEHLLIRPKRSYIKTTNSKHWMKKYPNLLTNVPLSSPEQVWVSDITYIKTDQGYSYLSLVTDAYSKKIMGYELSTSLSTDGPLKALKMAIKARSRQSNLIHHSDRGLQYCSAEYIKCLTDHQISVSMTQNGDPYENAIAERINGILKYEFLLIDGFTDEIIAGKAVAQSISIYNHERPHLSWNMLTPEMAHKQNGVLRMWNKKPRGQIANRGFVQTFK